MSDSNKTLAPGPNLATLRRSLTVPTTEPDPSAENPWADDLLNRSSLAKNLTNFIRPQREPLVISLHGSWGSGKTFFLRRWVQTLKVDSFPTFYYNAWEDDYAPAPLIPILTNLEETTRGHASRRLRKAALPFLLNVTAGAFKTKTGVDLRQYGFDSSSLLKDDAVFKTYRDHTTHRNDLRKALASLAGSSSAEPGRPTVCVIDELDRCRPTFAIELLETTKHIFSVPGLVFLLALNRPQLARSVESVYGNIDADTYLRRFFDVHLDLPLADTAPYSRALLARFGLDIFFKDLSILAKSEVHRKDYQALIEFLPLFWRHLRLSPRDIHHCVTGIAMTCRTLRERHFLFPPLLAGLLLVRLRKPGLYRRFVSGDATAAEVVNEIDSWVHDTDATDISSADFLYRGLESIEASLYATHRKSTFDRDDGALTQLRHVADGKSPQHFRFPLLSKKTAEGGPDRAKRILGRVPDETVPVHRYGFANREDLQYLARLIDLLSDFEDGRE